MIIIVDERELVIEGYVSSFGREGVASAGFHPQEFRDWLSAMPETDLKAIEAFLIGDSPEGERLPAVIRERSLAPVIAMSDDNSLGKVLKLFSAGVDDVVRKPVHVREILARASAIMSRHNKGEDAMSAGALTIFPDGRPPLVGGMPMQLPRREYRILDYLIRHKDRRVTKAQLFDYVYGIFEDNVEECVIESHISKLRKKLRMRLGYDPVDSKRYMGYCLHSAPPASAAAPTRPAAPRPRLLQTA